MTESLRPTRFQLLALTLLEVGPFRKLGTVDFVSREQGITNLFMIMGPNGGGKTTIMEAIWGIMGLLDREAPAGFPFPEVLKGAGGLQLDARVVLDDGARARAFVLSIAVGESGLLKSWTDDDIERVQAEKQIVLAVSGARVVQVNPALPAEVRFLSRYEGDPEALAFFKAVQGCLGDSPQDLFETAYGMPTVLYFPADRNLVRPPAEGRAVTPPANLHYRPAHRFGIDGAEWSSSLDNLFVWFAWLQDKREQRCRDLVNTMLFRDERKRLKEVDRSGLSVPVEVKNDDGTISIHSLDHLSSGERQFLQIITRIASHMTASTIVLIDEAELHLHLVLRRRLMAILKQWLRDYPDALTFVVASHQTDMLRIMAPKLSEPWLRKGGCLLKPKFLKKYDD
jgi:energy-coupling factor transporter ATP-binding protein EcfA2